MDTGQRWVLSCKPEVERSCGDLHLAQEVCDGGGNSGDGEGRGGDDDHKLLQVGWIKIQFVQFQKLSRCILVIRWLFIYPFQDDERETARLPGSLSSIEVCFPQQAVVHSS